jgi:hypothetical protein
VNVVELLEREQEKAEVPVLRSGDTVRVHVKVVEGTRERIQVFEGVVIALSGKTGIGATFTVRHLHRPPHRLSRGGGGADFHAPFAAHRSDRGAPPR